MLVGMNALLKDGEGCIGAPGVARLTSGPWRRRFAGLPDGAQAPECSPGGVPVFTSMSSSGIVYKAAIDILGGGVGESQSGWRRPSRPACRGAAAGPAWQGGPCVKGGNFQSLTLLAIFHPIFILLCLIFLVFGIATGAGASEMSPSRLRSSRAVQLAESATRRRTYASIAATLPKPGDQLHGFTLDRSKHVAALDLTALHFTHQKTGAQYLHVARDDPNNVFCIGFRTNRT